MHTKSFEVTAAQNDMEETKERKDKAVAALQQEKLAFEVGGTRSRSSRWELGPY